MRALPGVASSSLSGTKPPTKLTFVPSAAPAVPDAVLAAPLVGELWRYDGKTAPAGWMFTSGQALPVAQNRSLFSVLGTVAGGDGKTTFKLPDTPYPAIIAVRGMVESSPALLARSSRKPDAKVSLGPGAVTRPIPLRRPSAKETQELVAVRRLFASSVHAGPPSAVPLSTEQRSRFHAATDDARTAALAVLDASTRARLDAAIGDAVAGRSVLYDVVRTAMASLSPRETGALAGVNDAMVRPFNDRTTSSAGWSTDDAAHFLVSVAVTHAQAQAIAQQELSRER